MNKPFAQQNQTKNNTKETKMNLKINGESTTIEQETISVTDLLTHQNVKMPEMVTVEINGDILDRDQFETTTVKNNDEIEFLYFMGGGSQK